MSRDVVLSDVERLAADAEVSGDFLSSSTHSLTKCSPLPQRLHSSFPHEMPFRPSSGFSQIMQSPHSEASRKEEWHDEFVPTYSLSSRPSDTGDSANPPPPKGALEECLWIISATRRKTTPRKAWYLVVAMAL